VRGVGGEGAIREVSGNYVEVDGPRKLEFTWTGLTTNMVNMLVTVELNPRGNETEPVLTDERPPTTAIYEGQTRGSGKHIGPSDGSRFKEHLGGVFTFEAPVRVAATMLGTVRFWQE
jgi:uncharacterized protein YndB with AHSA1/START domain